MQNRINKVIIPNKIDRLNKKRFRIRKDRASEIDTEIDIADDGDYEVERLSTEGLPTHMGDGTSIRWFTNFAIRKNGQYINQRYSVKIPGLSSSQSRVVIFDRSQNEPYYYTGKVVNDTIELTDGDPGIGQGP